MSSHKKRRELNRATAEHTHARIRAELAQGIVNFENLMEHAMGVRIKELERERDAFYMDYRMKCDEEAKDSALVIIERDQLRTEMNEWRGQAHRSQSDADRLKEENDKLRAQINVLREALSRAIGDHCAPEHCYSTGPLHGDFRDSRCPACDGLDLLASTPEQSIAAYRNKVIEAFVNEFSRHVGGDGEFWLHELQDFAMKEQP